jgi:uncharacterized protein
MIETINTHATQQSSIINQATNSKPKFTVRTFDEKGLSAAAQKLAIMVQHDFQPNIIVGVRSGGYVIAEEMMVALPAEAILLPITCRRPSTARKSRFRRVKDVLQALPPMVTDRLRVMEHIMLNERKPPQPRTDFVPDAEEIAHLYHLLRLRGDSAKVLVVDDSIDSGATIHTVVALLHSGLSAKAELKTAAITVTSSQPLVEPDYSLYRHVLCRFPWALDFRAAATHAN